MKTTTLPLAKLAPNKGQVEGLPKNPRLIKDAKFRALCKSLRDDPEMMQLREIIAYDPGDGSPYVIVGGNMRYHALREIGEKQAPVKLLPPDTPAAKLRAYAVKDNSSYGDWDFDLLANEWDLAEITDWGVDIPDIDIAVEEPPKRAAWNSADDAKESVCDMVEHIALYKRDDLLITSFFKKSEEGVPLSLIKSKENVGLFTDATIRVLKGLVGFGNPAGWCLVTAPSRRHKDWNFSDACCKDISSRIGMPYYADVFEAKNRSRIKPEFHLMRSIEEPNIVVFDDILTTGSTLRAMAALLGGKKNLLFVVGINNN